MNTSTTETVAPFEIDGFYIFNLFGELVRIQPCALGGEPRVSLWVDLYEAYDNCRFDIYDTRDKRS